MTRSTGGPLSPPERAASEEPPPGGGESAGRTPEGAEPDRRTPGGAEPDRRTPERADRRAPYGIVGDGRMATHMARYFDLLSLPHRQWSRSRRGTADEALEGCDPVLLLVSDDAIETVAGAFATTPGRTLVHFSGAARTEVAVGMHPLCTFGPSTYDLATYREIPFVCEAVGPRFEDVFPELPNPHYAIAPDRKPLYHALAVLAGPFTTVLWTKLFDGFERELGLPRAAALPYLARVAANLADPSDSPHTGPLTRGDRATVRANLAALSGDPFETVYRAFVEAVEPGLLAKEGPPPRGPSAQEGGSARTARPAHEEER